MLIILPTEVEGLRQVEAQLSKLDFAQLQFKEELVAVQLPRFKVLSPVPKGGIITWLRRG